jgi:prophage regulatory protein
MRAGRFAFDLADLVSLVTSTSTLALPRSNLNMQGSHEPIWLSLNDVCKLTSLSRTTINTFRERGTFVEPIELGERRVAFPRDEVLKWMAERAASRRGADRMFRQQIAA